MIPRKGVYEAILREYKERVKDLMKRRQYHKVLWVEVDEVKKRIKMEKKNGE